MTEATSSTLDERTPRPDPRLDAVGVVAATAAAALAYVAALSADVLPSHSFAVVLFAVTPVLALVALLVFSFRAAAERDAALGWVAGGLGVGVVAMLLQLISFPLVTADGGVLGTSDDSNAALYLLFHLALALGALLGGLGAGLRRRTPAVVLGVAVSVALALDLLPLPTLLTDVSFTGLLVALELGLAGCAAVAAVVWLLRTGRSARPLHTWVGVALLLSVYDIVLNAVSAERFDAVWWSSLSMRAATYSVLALGAIATVLRALARSEQYTESELTRREAQLRESLATTEALLRSATETAETLESALRPAPVVAPGDVLVAARSRCVDGDRSGIGRSWYDTVLLPSGGLGMVVGQVDGHDLGALPVMGLVRGAVRSYALEGHPPSVVLERVNGFLASAGVGRWITVAYVELYPADRMVTVAVAGHRGPLVLQPGFGSLSALPCRPGPALGAEPTGHWDEQTVLLPQGSTMVLCTDRVVTDRAQVELPAQLSNRAEVTPEQVVDALLSATAGSDAHVVLAARPISAHRPAARRTLPVHRMSAGVARIWIGDLFALWRHAGVIPDEDFVDERAAVAQLIVTELVSNAVRHSDQTVTLEVALTGHTLRVEVSDSSHRMPVLHDAGSGDTSGRGLFLVQTLSCAWGVELTDTGKVVWAELEVDEQEQPDGDVDEDALLAAFSDPDDL